MTARASPGIVNLGSLAVRSDCHRGDSGSPTLRLAAGRYAIWFEIGAGDPLSGPFLPRFALEGTNRLGPQLRTLKCFAALVRTGRFAPSHFPPPRRAARLAAQLRAHDARAAGASLREIALALHGDGRVVADWDAPSDYLRLRTRRLATAAAHMVAGGYRRLLGA